MTDKKAMVATEILSPAGDVVAKNSSEFVYHGQKDFQNFLVNRPELWSPKSPKLYTARTTVSVDGKVVDSYDTRFGIRSIEYVPEKGFFLNGSLPSSAECAIIMTWVRWARQSTARRCVTR